MGAVNSRKRARILPASHKKRGKTSLLRVRKYSPPPMETASMWKMRTRPSSLSRVRANSAADVPTQNSRSSRKASQPMRRLRRRVRIPS